MRQKVINDGVDLVPIRDFIEKVLGIHLPRVNFPCHVTSGNLRL